MQISLGFIGIGTALNIFRYTTLMLNTTNMHNKYKLYYSLILSNESIKCYFASTKTENRKPKAECRPYMNVWYTFSYTTCACVLILVFKNQNPFQNVYIEDILRNISILHCVSLAKNVIFSCFSNNNTQYQKGHLISQCKRYN